MVNYHASFPALLASRRQISGYLPTFGSRTTLTQIPPCHLFFVTFSLSPHVARFIVHPVGPPHFRLKGSVGLAVGLAINWPAALPSSAAGPSRRGSSYYRSSYRRSNHCGLGPSKSDYRESSYRRSTHCGSTYRRLSH